MFSAIILGGGTGQRMGLGYNKVLYKINGLTLIEHSAKKFIDDPDFKEVVIVINRDDYDQVNVLFDHPKVEVIKGGDSRQESVSIGLNQLRYQSYVFIHDGARPNVSQESIQQLKLNIGEAGAILYTKANDSIISLEDNKIKFYIDRKTIGFVKTPQAFKTNLIQKAYEAAFINKRHYTDDASLFMQELNLDVVLVEDKEDNIKLTTAFDLKIMEELL